MWFWCSASVSCFDVDAEGFFWFLLGVVRGSSVRRGRCETEEAMDEAAEDVELPCRCCGPFVCIVTGAVVVVGVGVVRWEDEEVRESEGEREI